MIDDMTDEDYNVFIERSVILADEMIYLGAKKIAELDGTDDEESGVPLTELQAKLLAITALVAAVKVARSTGMDHDFMSRMAKQLFILSDLAEGKSNDVGVMKH